MIKKCIDGIKKFIFKNYKLLLAILLIIVILIVFIIIVNNHKLKPIINKIELGNYDININNPNTFFRTKIKLNGCIIDSYINIEKVGKYKYSLVCSDKTYGPFKIKVVDTTPPTVILKNMLITPTKELKVEDFFIYINDLSEYHAAILNPQDFDSNSEGAYDVHIMVNDKYGNKRELVTVLTVSEDGPTETIICDNLNKVGSVPSDYYIYLNNDGKICDVLKVTHFKYSNPEYYKEDLLNYRKKKLISGIDGNIVIKNMDITFYKYILDINYKDEFNINYIPQNKDDILRVFNNSCHEAKKSK